jgi:SAM-dependent methyltransferase
VTDAQALPFASDSFDVLMAMHMLYHVPDIELAAREMRRVLRDGGVCVAVTNGETAQRSLKDLVEDVVGNGWRWMGPSTGRFTVENGAVQLLAGFDSVETVWAPDVTFSVTDADALADYVGSIADIYEDQAGVAWADVVEECRHRAAAVIARDGAFPITGKVGAFVCR